MEARTRRTGAGLALALIALVGQPSISLADTLTPSPEPSAIVPTPEPSGSEVPLPSPTPTPSPRSSGANSPTAAVLAQVPADTSQLVVVTAPKWSSSRGLLTIWERGPLGTWSRITAVAARLGARGLAPAATRRQSTNTTPAGSFALGLAFGIKSAPSGTTVEYRRVTAADYWVYDPRDPPTYNEWVRGRVRSATWRASWAEHLISYSKQYRYALVIDYNHALGEGTPRLTGGGGIFLHVNGPGATAGCVSVSEASMRAIVRWLRPASQARIVIGPSSLLG
ncbi:MAG: L,D-transpeptidase family protein [Candidatus Nanopelagicales bacterium]